VTVEPWATSVIFGVDGLAAGQGTLTASAGNARVTAPVSVTASNQGGPGGGLRLSEVFFNPDGGDNMKEWIELANTSDQPINLSGWSLGAGGADFTYSVIPLQGEIPPGGCFVVGGPTTDATNASPLLDLPFDFDPDLQNSGQEADGVGLFNVPADMITESLRPTDVVLYGPNNNNMLPGPDGPPSSANLTTPRESQSAERTTEGWRSQAAPSPNDCSPLF
jgi:5'-nucleotidase